jgi:hypothetical protein
MKNSKKIIWFWLIIILFVLICIYFILDNINKKEGMDLEKTCINNSGTNICVPKTKNCLSKPDGSYDCI